MIVVQRVSWQVNDQCIAKVHSYSKEQVKPVISAHYTITHAAERPVLTVAQVFDLVDRVASRPVGNIRQLLAGGYRLRFARHGVRPTAFEVYRTRADAERALRKMAENGSADCDYDRRFRALVLLGTFASLRWGEVTALKRSDIDLEAGLVQARCFL